MSQTNYDPSSSREGSTLGATTTHTPARRTFTETKAGNGWRFASFAVAAYVISRGLAKLGVREPYREDR